MNIYRVTLFLAFLLDDPVASMDYVNEGVEEVGLSPAAGKGGGANNARLVMKNKKKPRRFTSTTTTTTTTTTTMISASATTTAASTATTSTATKQAAAVFISTTSSSAVSSSAVNFTTQTNAVIKPPKKTPSSSSSSSSSSTTATSTTTTLSNATATSSSSTTTKQPMMKPPLAVNLPDTASMSDIMNSLKAYHDKNQSPYRDRPTEVQLGIFVTNIYAISEQTMDFSLSMYFRQRWRDPRMAYNFNEKNKNRIRLMDESWNHFWVPDTFFKNEKSASFHKVTVNNRVLFLNSSGHVWYVMRLTLTLTCPMRLEMFPFDTQKCPIQFESFTFTMNTMFFGWLENPVELPVEIKPPQFELLYHDTEDCSSNYTTGAYPCAEINFVMQRDIGYYVIQVFIPSVLVVILSWVSFWINIDGVPARCTLGLLTVLTITTATGSVNANLPRVSYIKAIDVWLITCLIFVFCALLEYAFVNVAARNGVRIRTPIVRKAPLEAPPQPLPQTAIGVAAPPKTLPKPQLHTSTSSYSYKQVCVDSDDGTDQEFNSPDQPLLSKCWQRMKEHLPQQQQPPPPQPQQPQQLPQQHPITSSSSSSSHHRNKKHDAQEYQTTVDVEASKLKARKIDKMSRKIFPFIFLVFIVGYWMATCIPWASTGVDIEKREKYSIFKAEQLLQAALKAEEEAGD